MKEKMYIVYTIDPEYKEWGTASSYDNAKRASKLIRRLYNARVYIAQVE